VRFENKNIFFYLKNNGFAYHYAGDVVVNSETKIRRSRWIGSKSQLQITTVNPVTVEFAPRKQGCQIFLATNIPKREKYTK
jgi:hypothetical protein